jgi:hypothetical protein
LIAGFIYLHYRVWVENEKEEKKEKNEAHIFIYLLPLPVFSLNLLDDE